MLVAEAPNECSLPHPRLAAHEHEPAAAGAHHLVEKFAEQRSLRGALQQLDRIVEREHRVERTPLAERSSRGGDGVLFGQCRLTEYGASARSSQPGDGGGPSTLAIRERGRSLSWEDAVKSGDDSKTESSQNAAKTFESLAGVGAGGFEPP